MRDPATAHPSVRDPGAAVGALWDRLIAVAKSLDHDEWSLPTPCSDWDVHDVLTHCAAAQIELDGGPHVPPPEGWRPPESGPLVDRWTAAGVAARRTWEPERVRAELRAAREGHVARLQRVEDWGAGVQGPVGLTTEANLLTLRCYDLWVHLQDLHEALGEPIDLGDDSEAARAAHEYVIERVPWLLAKRVGAPDGAALRLVVAAPLPVDAVVAMRGGRGTFEAAVEEAGSAVRVAPEALTLLVSGRDGPEDWRARGLLDWLGPVAEAFVRDARFF